jgi:hypothetical protein
MGISTGTSTGQIKLSISVSPTPLETQRLYRSCLNQYLVLPWVSGKAVISSANETLLTGYQLPTGWQGNLSQTIFTK